MSVFYDFFLGLIWTGLGVFELKESLISTVIFGTYTKDYSTGIEWNLSVPMLVPSRFFVATYP